MTDDLTSTVSVLFSPGQVVEIRAITDDGIASGYFDSHTELVEKVSALDGVTTIQGIYATLNEVDPSLLSRRSNRIKMRLGKKDATTADIDIIRRRWLPIDIDPVRISGVSSTLDEHNAAIEMAGTIGIFLAEMGFPMPVVADSGNGAHLLYRIDQPNNTESLELIKKCLDALSLLFSDGVVTVDTANHNAARIWKLYGTVSRKGDNTSSRPHRRARIIEHPKDIGIVSTAQLERLAGTLPSPAAASAAGRPRAGGQPGSKFDLPAWFDKYGIGVASEKPITGGILYNLSECPFSSAHNDGAYAIEFETGGLFAACKHNSCGCGIQRWDDFREIYEPADKRKSAGVKPRPPGGSPPVPAVSTLPGYSDAVAVLQHGDPKGGMLKAFALDHEGDETVAECLLLSLASRSVINTNGLHVSVTGESGKGKSHTFTTILNQVPERLRISGAMSNKALFYMDGLHPGMAIVLDDIGLSEDMSEVLKGVTTSFRKPFLYRTVNKDRKGQVCVIPERCVWWVAKVEGSGDDQVFNRMLTCWIDDSQEQDGRVLVRVLEQSQSLPQDAGERPQVLICRAMWEMIGAERFYVVIPFANRIKFQSNDNRRNPEMLLDLIKSNAVIRFQQRDHVESAGIPCIVATREDFDESVKLYGMLNGTTGGQATKMTRLESNLVDTIRKSGWDEFTIPMLQRASGMSNGVVHKLLHGYSSRGSNYSGILEKCPFISYTDRTVVTDESHVGVSMRRRGNAYTFDNNLFLTWSSGGAVWISVDEDENNNYDVNSGSSSNPAAKGSNPAAMLQDSSACSTGPVSFMPDNSLLVGVQPDCQSCSSVAGFAETIPQPESQTDSTHTHLDRETNEYCCKSKRMGPHDSSQDVISSSLYDSEFAAGLDPKSNQQTPMTEPTTEDPAITLQQCSSIAAGLQQCCRIENTSQISSHDYKPLEYPSSQFPCAACGHKVTAYIEKLTRTRSEKRDKAAYRICKKCYERAGRREQKNSPQLTGIIIIGNLKRVSKDIGRCSVCKTGKALYHDRDAGLRLCQHCYDRETTAQGLVNGGAGQ